MVEAVVWVSDGREGHALLSCGLLVLLLAHVVVVQGLGHALQPQLVAVHAACKTSKGRVELLSFRTGRRHSLAAVGVGLLRLRVP